MEEMLMVSFGRGSKTLSALIAVLLTLSSPVFGQNTSGSITGVVQDASGAVIPGAQASLIDQVVQGVAPRQTITNEAGIFLFSALAAGTYTVTVELPGFKTYKKTDIKLFVNDRMGLPPIVLEVGSQSESVTVEAQTVQLETVSAERSGVVTGRQILDIALNGRDFTRLLKTVPGAPADAVSGSTTFNGQRANQNNFTVDGQTVTDSGVNQQFAYRISMDAIAEFKVSTTSQGAEFGRNSGAQVQVATKRGTQDFHGGGYWFKRHEGWNANSFTNNRQGTPRQIYRFLTAGYNGGGPAIKDKLFFFVSHEWGRQRTPPAPRRITVPTALERTGDFSQTRDGAGIPVYIKDPQKTGVCSAADQTACFPGNRIPAERFSPYGPQVLNWLPLPNVTGQFTYNYESQVAQELPSFDQIYRVDYAINSRWSAFVRVINSKQTQNNPYGRADSANNLALNQLIAPTFGWSVSANLSTIINPTLTNEFQFGKAKNGIPGDAPPEGSLYYRKNAKITIPLLFPNADPAGLIPKLQLRRSSYRQCWKCAGDELCWTAVLQRQSDHQRDGQPQQDYGNAYAEVRRILRVCDQTREPVPAFQRHHLVRQRRFESRRHAVGILERAAGELHAIPAVQPADSRGCAVLECRVLCAGQLEGEPEADAELRPPRQLRSADI
jgi:hypothetical protein